MTKNNIPHCYKGKPKHKGLEQLRQTVSDLGLASINKQAPLPVKYNPDIEKIYNDKTRCAIRETMQTATQEVYDKEIKRALIDEYTALRNKAQEKGRVEETQKWTNLLINLNK